MSTEEDSGGLQGEPDATVERTPTLLLLDTSSSMRKRTQDHKGERRKKIEQVNDGLEFFNNEIEDIYHAKTRIDIALVTFGNDVSVVQDFTTFDAWDPKDLSARGSTPMGEAIETGVKKLEDLKSEYKSNALPYNRPLIWLLTDGEPTDMREGDQMWDHVQELLERGTAEKHFKFFAMGVGDEADMDTLDSLVSVTDEDAIALGEGMFKEFFEILSRSVQKHSEPGGADDISPQMPTDSN